MHFGMKIYLKSTRNYTVEHALSISEINPLSEIEMVWVGVGMVPLYKISEEILISEIRHHLCFLEKIINYQD